MNIAIRYYTRSGNTEKLAKAIAQALGVQAEAVTAPLTKKRIFSFWAALTMLLMWMKP